MGHPRVEWFDPGYWRRQGAVTGEAVGRGSALFLETEFGPAVLRAYLRGGWASRVSRDRYFFISWERSRPAAEFRILAELAEAQLPVPAPLSAMGRKQGLFYRGWLMTRRIEGVEPLADRFTEEPPETWRRIGACIRRFHDFGVVHADLNARNILVGGHSNGDSGIYLIDFDRARIDAGNDSAFRANLQRLKRSLDKWWPDGGDDKASRWQALLDGYGAP